MTMTLDPRLVEAALSTGDMYSIIFQSIIQPVPEDGTGGWLVWVIDKRGRPLPGFPKRRETRSEVKDLLDELSVDYGMKMGGKRWPRMFGDMWHDEPGRIRRV
jgi:hypothetical protein